MEMDNPLAHLHYTPLNNGQMLRLQHVMEALAHIINQTRENAMAFFSDDEGEALARLADTLNEQGRDHFNGVEFTTLYMAWSVLFSLMENVHPTICEVQQTFHDMGIGMAVQDTNDGQILLMPEYFKKVLIKACPV